MLFTQALFLVFFAAVFALHWSLRAARARKLVLLVASYAFYASWDARFLPLLWLTSATGYGCGLAMGRQPERARRRPWLLVAVVVDLGILGFFKYHDFFRRSALELLGWLGLHASASTLDVVLPVGISFTTFQALGYAFDVYRGKLAPARDALDFALFVAFFPQVLAGPISRGGELLPQLAEPRRLAAHVPVRAALLGFLAGFVKKACVADTLATLVDPVFAEPAAHSRAAAWLAVALYHVQIYCDFAGYSDMAVASAALLGYRLPRNFELPYLARSIGEFWRRWHVTLSTWMRDYLYLPLVGKRPSSARRVGALLVTMGLCGLWHGAGWAFVGFGVLHGVYLVVEDLWRRSALARTTVSLRFLAWPLTTLVVLLTWPVFRLREFAQARALYGLLFGVEGGGSGELALGWLAVVALFYGAQRALATHALAERCARAPAWAFALAYGFAWSQVLPWVAAKTTPFLYSRF